MSRSLYIDAVLLDHFDDVAFSECVLCMLTLSGNKLVVVSVIEAQLVHMRTMKHCFHYLIRLQTLFEIITVSLWEI